MIAGSLGLLLLQTSTEIGLIERVGNWGSSTIFFGGCVALWLLLRDEKKRSDSANERTLAAYKELREVLEKNAQVMNGLTASILRLAERIETVEDGLQSERQRPRR